MEKKKLSKKHRNIIIASVLVVAALAGICVAVFKPEEKVKVETVSASKQTINETLDTTGVVSAASQDVFVLPSGAKILELNVKEGDIVEAGDVIATFDLNSLNEALAEKEAAYEKAQSAYKNAQTTAQQSKAKVAEVKKQIAELEKEIVRLEDKTNAANQDKSDAAEKKEQVKVSASLVKRFVNIAKLFGVEYTDTQAEDILKNMLSSGNSVNDLSSFMDNLGSVAGASGSFDLSSLMGMSGSSELMSAEMSLIQLKAQLATLELQSDSTYISAFKTIADKTRESYMAAQTQVNSMKAGWIATAKGIVSEVNVTEDGIVNTPASDIDISSILTAVTSGSDVSGLLSSFLNNGQAAVKILYYPLVADISLNKYDVLEVNLNQDVIVTSASGSEFEGKVSYVSAVASSSNGLNLGSLMGSTTASSTIPAQVTINNADSSVIVGVDVQVSIVTDTVENALVAPVEAICIDGEDIFVYCLEDGKAVKKNIELGIASDTHYQILSGINESDVLIKNTVGLADGVRVVEK